MRGEEQVYNNASATNESWCKWTWGYTNIWNQQEEFYQFQKQ